MKGHDKYQESQKSSEVFKNCEHQIKEENILISHRRIEKEEIEASRKGIANTFAKFYTDHYSDGSFEGSKQHDEYDATTKSDGWREDEEANKPTR